jgi:hypothetical protein
MRKAWLLLAKPFSAAEGSGQLRPYVRPVARRSPLAIMGVRWRVRHPSQKRARGTAACTVLPELFPAYPFSSSSFLAIKRHPLQA